MMAAREGHLPMVLLLLEHGADVNYTSAFGYNALNVALRTRPAGRGRSAGARRRPALNGAYDECA